MDTPSKLVSKPLAATTAPAQLKKQAQSFSVSCSPRFTLTISDRVLEQTHTGPLPAAFYASFPTLGKESSDKMRYYITSVKGFSSGTYHAVLDKDLQLIGQAHNAKKLTALTEAEAQSKEGKVLSKMKGWDFEERGGEGGKPAKPVNLNMTQGKKEATGPAPVLTHALAVSENEKARLSWLEWYSEDKKAWKCAVLIDAVFYGSAKHAERKQACESTQDM